MSYPEVGDRIPISDGHRVEGFSAITTKRGDTLWRPLDVVKGETEMRVVRVVHGKFYQTTNNVTWAYCKIRGYRYQALAFFKDGQRIA